MKFGGKEIHPLLKLFTMNNIKRIVDQDEAHHAKLRSTALSLISTSKYLLCARLLQDLLKIDEFHHFPRSQSSNRRWSVPPSHIGLEAGNQLA